MPAQKFASRLLLDDLQNGAFINEGILRATPFPLPFFFFFFLPLLTVFRWLTLFLLRLVLPRTIIPVSPSVSRILFPSREHISHIPLDQTNFCLLRFYNAKL